MVASPGHPCLDTVGYIPRRASKSALRSPLRHIIVDLKCTPCLCETSRSLCVYFCAGHPTHARTRPMRATPPPHFAFEPRPPLNTLGSLLPGEQHVMFHPHVDECVFPKLRSLRFCLSVIINSLVDSTVHRICVTRQYSRSNTVFVLFNAHQGKATCVVVEQH